jgi:hypothetical protein
MEFAIVSDLYVAGRTEEGREYTAEVYFVMAEDEQGNRWTHYAHFPGCEVGTDDEGLPFFSDVRDVAKARAGHLLDRILESGGAMNLSHWRDTSPAYGSAAYIAYGQADDLAAESAKRYAETGCV